MTRGEIWWVDFPDATGGEIRKRRPAVIVSNDMSNRFLNRVQIVPLTSNVQKLYPGEAMITVNGEQRKALASQIGTATKERVQTRIGRIVQSDLEAVERAIKTQLGLS